MRTCIDLWKSGQCCAHPIYDISDSPQARDHRGQTALHLAAQSGDIGLVQVLLEYGADPNAQEETTGWTPLPEGITSVAF